MTLKIYSPVLPVSQGGLGAKTGLDVSTKLGLAHISKANQPNGFLRLNDTAEISTDLVPNVAEYNLIGSGSVAPNSVTPFTIDDYDCYTTYVVTVSAGSFILSNDTITFTAPATPGNVTMTVNGRFYTIQVA